MAAGSLKPGVKLLSFFQRQSVLVKCICFLSSDSKLCRSNMINLGKIEGGTLQS